MYYHRRSSYKRAGLGFPLTDLTLPQLCACPKPRPGFPTSYVVGLFMFSEFS